MSKTRQQHRFSQVRSGGQVVVLSTKLVGMLSKKAFRLNRSSFVFKWLGTYISLIGDNGIVKQ
ncbi:hypothetical protein GV64_08065 [Endozoicomonas elysicola]|uniref:Uncharacterized protein n=1 Tax=Endozoicomonas elysicola TaxID=305900 RepID=A0A081K975_9GAMM|nr:hypothetical protein GV64_08065 [Endozoicomonas elysicola]